MAAAALAVGGTPNVSVESASAPVAAGPLGPLADLAVRRIMPADRVAADRVAAAKFGTGQPIDDPVRERQVLETVARLATTMGLPPKTGVRLRQAQIEANKVVQRGLSRRWTRHPEQRPSRKPVAPRRGEALAPPGCEP